MDTRIRVVLAVSVLDHDSGEVLAERSTHIETDLGTALGAMMELEVLTPVEAALMAARDRVIGIDDDEAK
jgi:hypothetical protein